MAQTTSSLPVRFWNHAVFGLRDEVAEELKHEENTKNWCEKFGDRSVYITKNAIPNAISGCLKDPRVVTVALTALALITISLAFYPITTALYLQAAWAAMPLPSFGAVKFAVYLWSCAAVVSLAARAQGRFCNAELMERFYKLPAQTARA